MTNTTNNFKFILIATSLFSFSVLASTSPDSLKKESMAKPVAAKVISSKAMTDIQNKIQKLDDGEINISRRQVDKKTRSIKKNIEKPVNQQVRLQQPIKSTRSNEFEFFDSWVSLDSDFDGDGYYSEFSLSFDADTVYSSADVYAEVYLSLEGGSWLHLYTSDDFSIYSNSETDSYSVSFGLNFDYPTGEYDVLVDLYEVGYSGVVATIGPDDDGDLYALPLEDEEHELDNDNTLISYVASELFADLDHDGYYTQVTLEYDINTSDSGRTVYAEVDITDSITFQQRTVETQNFQLGNQTEFIDIDFASGYVPSYYDFEIRLIDLYTGEIIANAAQDFSSLTQLPVESEEYDYSNVDVDVHVSGGGSLGFGFLLLAGLMGYKKRH